MNDELRHYAADRIYLTANSRLSEFTAVASRMNINAQYDIIARDLCFQLVTYIHGMLDHKIEIHEKYPADWWQAFKERWFPKWAKRKWPVRYSRIDVSERIYKSVCPHLEDNNNGTHLAWMAKNS